MDDGTTSRNLKRKNSADRNAKLKLPKKEEVYDSDEPEELNIRPSRPSRSKPSTRGVHQVKPCPTDCLKTSPNFVDNRKKLTELVTKELRADGKNVYTAIFWYGFLRNELGAAMLIICLLRVSLPSKDGVAFDWYVAIFMRWTMSILKLD